MLKVLFTQDAEAEDLFCSVPFSSKPTVRRRFSLRVGDYIKPAQYGFVFTLLESLMRMVFP